MYIYGILSCIFSRYSLKKGLMNHMIYIFLTHIPKLFFGQSTPLYMCARMRNSYSSVSFGAYVLSTRFLVLTATAGFSKLRSVTLAK